MSRTDALHLPTNEIVVLPPVAQFQDKLLPKMSDSPQPPVVVVDQTHAQRQAVGQAVTGGRLQLVEKVLE